MRKWLRGRFAWRFSLMRLVIATVFLGVFVGLNMERIGPFPEPVPCLSIEEWSKYGDLQCPYYFGWPLPFTQKLRLIDSEDAYNETISSKLPLTHGAHVVLAMSLFYGVPRGLFFGVCALIDLTVALIPLFLILFLQIPRHPGKAEA